MTLDLRLSPYRCAWASFLLAACFPSVNPPAETSTTTEATDSSIGSTGSSTGSSTSLGETTGSTAGGKCGDEVVDPGETCDDGKNNGQPGLCRSDCTICGDGVLQADVEECDDGGESATCDDDCTAVVCGDGVVNEAAGEACEGGESPTCDADCTSAECGDGVVNESAGESCDDGNNTLYDGCEPTCYPTPFGVVAAGDVVTCALPHGAVRCWGRGDFGQLGYGNVENVGDDELPSTAMAVEFGGTAVQVDTNALVTCALVDGSVYCWGRGSSGALGYGSTSDLGKTPETLPGSLGAVKIGGSAVQVVTGGYHTCALLEGPDGDVRCWGTNQGGRLGDPFVTSLGDMPNNLPESRQPIALGYPAVQLTAGGEHTCAILGNGDVRCWGNGEGGRLGYAATGGTKCLNVNNSFTCTKNDKDNTENPECCIGDNEVPNTGAVMLGEKALQISAGSSHTCAVLTDGSVVCWGRNPYGQLGYGNIGNSGKCVMPGCTYTECCVGDDEYPKTAGPVSIGGTALQVSAGGNHTCVLLAGGDVRCWGQGTYGQLGLGHSNNVGDDEMPSDEKVLELGGKAIQIAAGDNHTCALMEGGEIKCWGYGAYGGLGYGNTAGNICEINNQYSCAANDFCCIGDKIAEMPPKPVSYL